MSSGDAQSRPKPMRSGSVTLLQINDTHGYLEPHPELVWQGGAASYPTLGG